MRLLDWLPFGGVPEIDAQTLARQLRDGATPQLVDVRTELEWNRSHIAGAVCVPVTQLKARMPSLALDKSRPVIAICLSGHRSIPAVRLLRANGFEACQLRKGMQAWWAAGLAVQGSQAPDQNK